MKFKIAYHKAFFIVILLILQCSIAVGSVPLTKADNTNLAPIPNASFWSYPNSATSWCLANTYDSVSSYYLYPVSYGGQTYAIRLSPCPSYVAQGYPDSIELDGECCHISPGEAVSFSAYLWVGSATTTEYNYNGGAIGFDVYASNGQRIGQMNNVDGVGEPDAQKGQYVWTNTYVPFGNGGWVQLAFTTTIQSSQEADNGTFTPMTPAYMIPWICLSSANPSAETAIMYVYDTVLTISSSSSPSIASNPSSGAVGSNVTVSGSGFLRAGESVTDASSNSASAILNVTQYSPIDFFHEGTVDSLDFFYFMNAYVQYNANGVYNPACDLNHDGKIDAKDFFLFIHYYTQYCETFSN